MKLKKKKNMALQRHSTAVVSRCTSATPLPMCLENLAFPLLSSLTGKLPSMHNFDGVQEAIAP